MWVFGGLLAYGLVIHVLLVIDPQPIEYREGGMLYTTHQLLSGVNIYDFQRQPYDLNVYGPTYNWLAATLSPLLGAGFTSHRVLSAVFIFASCALIAWVSRVERYSIALPVLVAGVWYASMLRLWGVGARPDAMAMSLYMLSVFAPWRLGFSKKSVVLSAVCSILAFFTKPYLAAGIGCVVGYLLWRRQIRLAIATAILYGLVLLGLAWLASLIGDAYFYDTVFVNLGYSGSWNWPHFFDQVIHFMGMNLPLIVCLGYALLVSGRGDADQNPGHLTRRMAGVPDELQYLLFSGSFALVVLLRISHNGGSGEYFVHLLTPIFLVAGYRFLALRGMMSLALIAATLQLAILLPRYPHSHEQEWRMVRDTIAKEANVMHSPSTVQFALARGETVFDSGQTEFFPGGLKQGGVYYPLAGWVWNGFQADLLGRVTRQEFSLLLLNVDRPAIIARDLVRWHYALCGTLPAPMYRNPENSLELWRPVCPAGVSQLP